MTNINHTNMCVHLTTYSKLDYIKRQIIVTRGGKAVGWDDVFDLLIKNTNMKNLLEESIMYQTIKEQMHCSKKNGNIPNQ